MMITIEERQRRAGERVHNERVRPIALGDGTYLVASSSTGGRGYRVHVHTQSKTITCTCAAGQWALPCKHAEAVRLLHADGQGVQVALRQHGSQVA